MTDLLPGPHHAVPATPPRASGSVRRTTSIDVTRPDGLLGRIVADVRGQDVRTGADGDGRVVDRLAATIEIDQRSGEVAASGDLNDLVGVNVRKGYGRRLAELLPDEAARRSLVYSALDDLGGAVLVSGYALLRGGAIPASPERGEQVAQHQADVCAGWASGAPLLETLRETGHSALPLGPAAPAIEGDDPLGWHPMAELATTAVRRRRRLDVADRGLVAQSHFRDSYAADDGDGHGEMVMHEYLVDARIGADRRLARVDVQPRVLPWHECPGAAASAQRLVGVAVDDIPARVRTDLVGPTTCTHLNSTLRCLADLRALASLLTT